MASLPAQGGITNAVINDSTAVTVGLNDAVVNCDMAKSPTSLGILKAIVYGDGEPAGSTGPAGIFVEDFNGNKVSINLPNGAVQPDVAIANSGPTSSSVLYQIVVAYCIGQDLYVDRYNLANVGFTNLSITAPTTQNRVTRNCNGYPHIDMWYDNGLSSYGGAMHEYAVVWSEGSDQDLYHYHENVTNSIPSFTPINLGGVDSCRMPDVACFMNVNLFSPNFTDLFLVVTYGDAPSTTAPVDDLYVDEFHVNNSYARTPSLGYPILLFSGTSGSGVGAAYGAVYAQRIEAMGFWGEDAGQLKFQVVADIQASASDGPYTVMGFNDNNLSGYSLSSSQFTYPTDICMAACVAAGLIGGNLSPAIGNNQYTAGFWNSNSSELYARDIISTDNGTLTAGDLINPTTWFEVNLSTNPIGYTSQIAKNFALSNCSNEGDDLLAAWYDGSDIRYKYITSNPMVFRIPRPSTRPATLLAGPLSPELQIQNAKDHTGYAILDVNGKIVLSGTLNETNTISTFGLYEGRYTLRVLGSNNVPQILRFNKI